MKTKSLRNTAAIAATLLSTLNPLLSTCFAQGSLTPPGAPAPTMKTLSQVEPRFPILVIPTNLTVSGSYYLTANLIQTLGVTAITIGTDDITIDLNGFALIGTNGAADGITHGGGIRKNICIKNGTIRNWRKGMELTGGGNDLIDHVRIYGNTEHGIHGFVSCTITDCQIADNGLNGILLVGGSASLIRGCMVSGNGLDGIQVVGNTVIMGNQCTGPSSLASTNAGIRATSSGNRIDGNHIAFYGNGVLVSASGNLVVRNTTSLTATNFAIGGGNLAGPIYNNATGLSNNPYANLAY